MKVRTIIGIPGNTLVYHPSLVGRRILGVCREGAEYTKSTDGTPGNMEYYYIGGRVVFEIAFTGLLTNDVREKIFIKYQ